MELYYKTVFYILSGVIGLCVGSFLNVVIYRVPNGISVATPASHCPECKKPIKWYDNIPVISYIILGGKCRNCKVHIPFRYTAVELLNTVLWLLAAFLFYDSGIVFTLSVMATASILICVFFIDLENMIIPDRFQIMLVAVAVAVFFFEKSPYSGIKHWHSNLIGGIAGFAIFYLIALVAGKIAGREAMGGGDVKLAGVMGLFLGWHRLLLAVLIASVSASIIILISKAVKGEKGGEYPFAPFLSTGFMISILFGNSMINWYISLITV